MIHLKNCTPIPALLVCVSTVGESHPPHTHPPPPASVFKAALSSQCAATILILCVGETHNLINYVSFINFLSYGVTIAGLLYFRHKKPDLFRPIKVRLGGRGGR